MQTLPGPADQHQGQQQGHVGGDESSLWVNTRPTEAQDCLPSSASFPACLVGMHPLNTPHGHGASGGGGGNDDLRGLAINMPLPRVDSVEAIALAVGALLLLLAGLAVLWRVASSSLPHISASVHLPMRIGKIAFNPQRVLGTGSHGTVVYAGAFEVRRGAASQPACLQFMSGYRAALSPSSGC